MAVEWRCIGCPRMKLKERAARVLDYTHGCADRGPRTFQARLLLSSWLDGAAIPRRRVKRALLWLEYVARIVALQKRKG